MATTTVKIEAALDEPLDRELRSLAATTGRALAAACRPPRMRERR